MKALLDTSFLRHLEFVDQLSLVSDMSSKFNWQFIMPKVVFCELEARGIGTMLSSLLKDIISIDSCNDAQILTTKSLVPGLDEGELEAICIVDQCKDRTFKNYLILTDDKSAQKKAGELGMKSLDVIMFLFLTNKQNLLSKSDAIVSLETLEKNSYFIDELVKQDYIKRLR